MRTYHTVGQALNVDPWQELANAIILQAVKDYRAAYRRVRRFPKDPLARSAVQEIVEFFCSDYFSVLSTLDGPALLRRITNEIEKEEKHL